MNLLAAVTFADGIGVDDLTWLAGLISAIAVIVGAVWAMLRPVRAQLHRWEDFWDDWTGTPAGPGRSAVPGVMERLQSIDGELQHNGGNSLKDQVADTVRKVDDLAAQNAAEHADLGDRIQSIVEANGIAHDSLSVRIDELDHEIARWHTPKEKDVDRDEG